MNEYLKIANGLAIRNNAPLYLKISEFKEYADVVTKGFQAIEEARSVRLVVLEAWLLLDYSVRESLSNLWSLKECNSDDGEYDLRYKLLPQSLENCVSLLERVLKIQRNRPKNPNTKNWHMPLWLLDRLQERDPNTHQKLVEVFEEHYKTKELSNPKNEDGVFIYIDYSHTKFRFSDAWVDALELLDESCFRDMRHLNKARNLAAHSHDENKIVSALGISGNQPLVQVQDKCISILHRVIGVLPIKSLPEDANIIN